MLKKETGMETKSDRTICISEYDLDRLQKLIDHANPQGRDLDHLQELEQELERGVVMSPREIPDDVITMNTKVLLKNLDTGETVEYQLVFPHNANIEERRISILAPIGTALLGYRVGDTIEWKVPAGVKRLKVEKILYQPEAAGHFQI
jgi:regulator of nucleoside diphosphate kinase